MLRVSEQGSVVLIVSSEFPVGVLIGPDKSVGVTRTSDRLQGRPAVALAVRADLRVLRNLL